LVWLLEKLPSEVILEVCKIADLSLANIDEHIIIEVQPFFKNSRPDALVEFAHGKYLIIETKLYPNSFNKEQFINHFNGGKEKLGENNIWLLFLSGDEDIPKELCELKKKYNGRIGFISWKSLIKYFKDNINSLGDKFKIIIEEFILFANHYKLGRLISMNNEEIKKFFEIYPIIAFKQGVVREKLLEILNYIKDLIIVESKELIKESSEDMQYNLPCLYTGFDIKGWYLKELGAYIFIDVLLKKIGIVLTGYQDKQEKEKFFSMWDKYYKNKYKNDPNLKAFKWVFYEEEYDTKDIKGGYFKLVEGTNSEIFTPSYMTEFESTFYWGYVYDLDLEKIQIYKEIIPKDFKKLLKTFLPQ
jgi:hypothetical protein